MQTSKTPHALKDLVYAWETAQLRRNPEYQRGAAWSLPQKQALIDSAFRKYPLPPLLLEKVTSTKGLGGETSAKYEVVDGQQRLLALYEFYADGFPLLASDDKKLRLPSSLRAAPSPWAKKRYSDLPTELKTRLDETTIDVYVLEGVDNTDRIRDLFIRLQSGTALTRQQIRDAWPGNAGPFIQSLAGKLTQRPMLEIFQLIDKRGTRLEDDDLKDPYVNDRQTCAQFLRLFLARERDARAVVGVAANDLDGLYHEQTGLEVTGGTCREFVEILKETTHVIRLIAPISSTTKKNRRTKIRKLDAFAIVMLFQDLRKSPNLRFDHNAYVAIAKSVGEFEKAVKSAGNCTSGTTIHAHYERFREFFGDTAGISLDPRRQFDDQQRQEIWKGYAGFCAICSQPVEDFEAEYDHFPIPHRDGGRTNIDNGRLVHRHCHPRGRPVED
jgi:Protein of unknown function DUF262/HNH endonuclease